jgi:hypothetical protein
MHGVGVYQVDIAMQSIVIKMRLWYHTARTVCSEIYNIRNERYQKMTSSLSSSPNRSFTSFASSPSAFASFCDAAAFSACLTFSAAAASRSFLPDTFFSL